MLYAPTGEFHEFCDLVGINLGSLKLVDDEYPKDVSKPEDLAEETAPVLHISFEEGEEKPISILVLNLKKVGH